MQSYKCWNLAWTQAGNMKHMLASVACRALSSMLAFAACHASPFLVHAGLCNICLCFIPALLHTLFAELCCSACALSKHPAYAGFCSMNHSLTALAACKRLFLVLPSLPHPNVLLCFEPIFPCSNQHGLRSAACTRIASQRSRMCLHVQRAVGSHIIGMQI